MTTLEQVEKLREKANVSYDEAKAALDAANGDLLEALIFLEKQGKTTAPAGGGYYSSAESETKNAESQNQAYRAYPNKNYHDGETFSSLMKKFGRFLVKIVHMGNVNYFEVLKGQENKASIPVTVLALLLIFAFWVTIPLMIVGLFFGLRYRFSGPNFNGDTVNHAMDSAADAAENLKKSINQK
nr:ubiquitin [uncultured Caproiciproducens sp.]